MIWFGAALLVILGFAAGRASTWMRDEEAYESGWCDGFDEGWGDRVDAVRLEDRRNS